MSSDMDQAGIGAGASVLLEGAEISGDIRTGKDMLLEGVVRGDVACEGKLVIGRNGMVEGNIVCRELVLDGLVAGNADVDGKTCLTAAALIKGFLQTSCLLLHPEAVIEKGLRLKDNK